MPRNIEIKARLREPQLARATAERLATECLGEQHQVDTYFHVPHGRLKLREIDGEPAQLVWYLRSDTATAKGSDYTLTPVADAESLKHALTGALGVKVVVDKRREIWLWRNVRIHLDNVAGLGNFLEFEAVLGNGVDDAQGQEQVAHLSREFGLTSDDLVPNSYSDLLLKSKT